MIRRGQWQSEVLYHSGNNIARCGTHVAAVLFIFDQSTSLLSSAALAFSLNDDDVCLRAGQPALMAANIYINVSRPQCGQG